METKNLKNSITKNRIEILIMLGLFLFAFGIRTIPSTSPSFKGVYGFDPTFHARMIRYVVIDGQRPNMDPVSYWPESHEIRDQPVYHYLSAYAYQAYALATTGSAEYQEPLFFRFVAYLPAIAGGLAAVGMYLLAKQIKNRKAGIMAGVLMAVQTTVLFRSMYGFAEEDALGIALTILTLAAYVWAFNKGGWKRGLLAGTTLMALIMTWSFSPFTVAFIPLFVAVNSIFMIISKHYQELENNLEVFASSLAPILLIPLLAFVWQWPMSEAIPEMVKWAGFFIPVVFFLMAVSYYFNYYKDSSKKDEEMFKGMPKEKAYQIGLASMIVIGILFFAVQGDTMVNYVNGLFRAVGQSSKLSKTVGEEHAKTIAGVLGDMNWLLLPFIAAMFYMPLKRLFEWKNPKMMYFVPVLFAAITFYLYAEKGKMGYIFGPAFALIVGIFLADMIGFGGWLIEMKKASKKTGDIVKALAMFFAVTILFTQISIAMNSMDSYKTGYVPQPEWNDMYDYLKDQQNENIVVMTWWDYGHWTAWNNIKTTLDNTNANSSKVIETAKIFTDPIANSSAELEKKHLDRITRGWQVTHVAVDRTLLTNKWGALTFLGDNNCIPNSELKKAGLSFPYLSKITEQYGLCAGSAKCPSGYDCTFSGQMGIASCRPQQLTQDSDEKIILCNMFKERPITFTEQEWAEIVNTPWPGYDLQVEGMSQPIKVYGQPDYKIMFYKVGNSIISDCPMNYMLGVRWFFRDPTLKYSKLVTSEEYNMPNREVVMHKIDSDGNQPRANSSGLELPGTGFNI